MIAEKEYKELLAFAETVINKSPIIQAHDLVHDAYLASFAKPKINFRTEIRSLFFEYRRALQHSTLDCFGQKLTDKIYFRFCKKCRDDKPIACFRYRQGKNSPGIYFNNTCIVCENREANVNAKKYYSKNKDKPGFKKRKSAINKKWRRKWVKKNKGTPEYEAFLVKHRERERIRTAKKRHDPGFIQKRKIYSHHYNSKNCAKISDSYCKSLIAKRGRVKRKDITKEMIVKKRKAVKAYRKKSRSKGTRNGN